jgi:hypothetical protein
LGGGEVSINLNFFFSGSSLVYSKKYGLKKSEGQKKPTQSSYNTFNRQKIIIAIFVNETKCIFEKNFKKPTPKMTPDSTPCFTTCRS